MLPAASALEKIMKMETLDTLDHVRQVFNDETKRSDRSEIGQFLTPVSLARFMSSLFEKGREEVSILDPGAGAGALFATCVETLISKDNPPRSVKIVAYETDIAILPHLQDTLERCRSLCLSADIDFH